MVSDRASGVPECEDDHVSHGRDQRTVETTRRAWRVHRGDVIEELPMTFEPPSKDHSATHLHPPERVENARAVRRAVRARRRHLRGWVLSIGLLLAVREPSAAPTIDLRVQVQGLRNTHGLIRLALFDTEQGYPEDNKKARATLSAPIQAAHLSLRLPNLEPGVYALAVLHDENQNGQLDRNLVGIPTEGIGASNDATRRWGPPRFEDAKFTLQHAGQSLAIRLHYWM